MDNDLFTGAVKPVAAQDFLTQLQSAVDDAHTQQALIYLDLNQYDLIGAKHGPAASDELLRQVAEVLHHQISTRDVLTHLKNGEFAVLARHDSGHVLAEQLCDAIKHGEFDWQGAHLNVDSSVGLLMLPTHHKQANQVLEAAANACYQAKAQGPNSVYVHEADNAPPPPDQPATWASSIEQALESNRLTLEYQSMAALQVQNRSETLMFEILLRMHDELGHEVLPSAFLPSVASQDLAIQLDRWVVTETIEWLLQLGPQMHRIGLCAINISAASLDNSAFASFLLKQLDREPDLAHKLCFEFKEELALSQSSKLRRFIQPLRERGCRFVLDEFGLGWSSFIHLKNMPIDLLKIDGTLIDGILEDPTDYAIVKSIAEISQTLGKQVIAACVETEEIRDTLCALKVDYAQGHYIDYPKPLGNLAKRITIASKRQASSH